MFERFSYVFVLAGIISAAAVVWAAPVRAHGSREVAGVSWTVGWAEEPAFVGSRNAVQLSLERDGAPLQGAEETLEVEVSLGDATTERMALRTVFDSPGEYRADLIPTVPGGYTFRFVGEVDGETVDESFTAPEDGFDEVRGTSEIAFPGAAPSTSELGERLEGVEQVADDARDGLMIPRIVSVAALVLAAAALAAALHGRRAA